MRYLVQVRLAYNRSDWADGWVGKDWFVTWTAAQGRLAYLREGGWEARVLDFGLSMKGSARA